MQTNLKLTAMASTVIGLAVVSARAGVTISVSQVGSNVVATGGGTLNLTDLTSSIPSLASVSIEPSVAYLGMGTPPDGPVTLYSGISGPSQFGTGSDVSASSGSGDYFGMYGSLTYPLLVPSGYVSGTTLSSADTYSGQSLASLGLTPGTYTWTWGTGVNADSFTVQISAVPEPSTAILVTSGAVAFVTGWFLRRRHQRRQEPA
jgi:hypothetical protein